MADFTLGPGRPIPVSPWIPGGPGSPLSPYKTIGRDRHVNADRCFVRFDMTGPQKCCPMSKMSSILSTQLFLALIFSFYFKKMGFKHVL